MNRAKANTLLLTAAAIWGFAFVAQREGMKEMGPFMFNGIRFFLGGAVLLPLLWLGRRRSPLKEGEDARWPARHPLAGCLLAGVVLFFGASLQQAG
ncbi:MAG: EamA family transporter, partial [Planctomycetota bacterium]